MDFLRSIIISFSFFTIIPMPMIEWTEKRMKFVPQILPLVGIVIGGLAFGLVKLLVLINAGSLISAALLSVYFLVITGGVHADGLMDSADAYFSRREKERKLEIMKDSRVGAFAVIALVVVVLLKTAFLYEIFETGRNFGIILLMIPVVSRCLQPSMLYFFPYARDEGLAKMYGGNLKKLHGVIPLAVMSVAAAIMIFTHGIIALIIPGIAVAYYCFYYLSARKNFGGITGDLLGAFLEVSEMMMIGAILLI
ncbi:MAG: adenosylcobinamide-GDP ribazoletransferase [Clostridia bacterium]|nr:adenosylcobinamide-GDP ribazoletransferase [Clostridia bacterium]